MTNGVKNEVPVRVGSTWLRVLCFITVLCQTQSCVMGAEQDDVTYQTLVQRVKGGDFTVDFRALRLACMKSSQCKPRSTPEELTTLTRALTDNDLKKAVEIAEKLIEQGFVNLEVHADCVRAYAGLNEPAKSKFHLDVTTALMRSIFATGDGKTQQTAFEVICDREEYDVLAAMGLPDYGPSVSPPREIADGAHRYERWEVVSPKTGKKVVVFFNIDAFSTAKSRVSNPRIRN